MLRPPSTMFARHCAPSGPCDAKMVHVGDHLGPWLARLAPPARGLPREGRARVAAWSRARTFADTWYPLPKRLSRDGSWRMEGGRREEGGGGGVAILVQDVRHDLASIGAQKRACASLSYFWYCFFRLRSNICYQVEQRALFQTNLHNFAKSLQKRSSWVLNARAQTLGSKRKNPETSGEQRRAEERLADERPIGRSAHGGARGPGQEARARVLGDAGAAARAIAGRAYRGGFRE